MSDTPVTTSSAVAEAVRELGIATPAVLDPITRYDASQPKPETQGDEPQTPPATETKPDEAPATDPKPAEPPAEAKPVIPDVPQNEDEAFNLTAEDFAEMEKNPLAKKAYKSMLRGFRAKTMALAEKRKAFEADEALIAQIKTNPRAAIQALATVANLPVTIGGDAPAAATGQPAADPVKATLDAASKQLDDVLTPEGAKVLRPVLENMMRAIAEQAVAPYKTTAEQLQRTTAEANLQSTVKGFGAARIEAGDEWGKEIEAEMAGLVGKVLPGRGMDMNGYVSMLYDQVMARRIRAAEKTRSFERLRAAASAAEPTHSVRTPVSAAPQITTGMTRAEALKAAVAAARSEMR